MVIFFSLPFQFFSLFLKIQYFKNCNKWNDQTHQLMPSGRVFFLGPVFPHKILRTQNPSRWTKCIYRIQDFYTTPIINYEYSIARSFNCFHHSPHCVMKTKDTRNMQFRTCITSYKIISQFTTTAVVYRFRSFWAMFRASVRGFEKWTSPTHIFCIGCIFIPISINRFSSFPIAYESIRVPTTVCQHKRTSTSLTHMLSCKCCQGMHFIRSNLELILLFLHISVNVNIWTYP